MAQSAAEKSAVINKNSLKQSAAVPETNVSVLYDSRDAQIEALYALENSRAEGAEKA